MEMFGMNLSSGEIVIAAVLFLVLIALAYLAYSGLFHSVQISVKQPPLGQAIVAYKFRRGPYQQCGDIFVEIEKLIGCKKSLAIFYDNPQEVPGHKCRYAVGAVLSEDGSKLVNDNDAEILKDNGFSTITLPRVPTAVQTTFPFVNRISIWLKALKVYIKLDNYIVNNKLSWGPGSLEIYFNGTIYFMVPQSRQDEFVVPAAKEN